MEPKAGSVEPGFFKSIVFTLDKTVFLYEENIEI